MHKRYNSNKNDMASTSLNPNFSHYVNGKSIKDWHG
jgi:hypothetical protein